MRTFVVIVLLCLFANVVFSQQDPQMSFNSFNHLAVNPGFAGMNQSLCFTSINRNQWMGFDGHPLTSTVAAHMSIDKINSGAGINIVSDKIGFNKDFHANLAYSYHVVIGEGLLGIGAGFGLIQKAFDAQELSSPQSIVEGSNVYYDPCIPHSESKVVFDANAGLFYRTKNFYAGLSSTHLTQPQLKYEDLKNPFVRRHYYLTSAFYWQLPNPLFEIRPSVFAKFDGTTLQYDLNGIVIFNKKFWGGLTYRLQDAVSAMVGFTTISDLGFGLAYDITLSSLRSYESGSIELMIKYCYRLQKKKRTTYRSVRFLENATPL